MNPSQFVQQFPEFSQTDPPLIAAKLALAAVRMGGPDVTVWGPLAQPGQPITRADLAQGYLAADALITSPFGAPTSLAKKVGKSSYREEFEELELAAAGGFVVAGGAWTSFPPGGTY